MSVRGKKRLDWRARIGGEVVLVAGMLATGVVLAVSDTSSAVADPVARPRASAHEEGPPAAGLLPLRAVVLTRYEAGRGRTLPLRP